MDGNPGQSSGEVRGRSGSDTGGRGGGRLGDEEWPEVEAEEGGEGEVILNIGTLGEGSAEAGESLDGASWCTEGKDLKRNNCSTASMNGGDLPWERGIVTGGEGTSKVYNCNWGKCLGEVSTGQ